MHLKSAFPLTGTACLLAVLPIAVCDADYLEGYGYSSYKPICAAVCQEATPNALECPEYVGMNDTQKAQQRPSPACLAGDASYLTTMAWCIKAYCNDTPLLEIEDYWENRMIGSQINVKTFKYPSYFEALAAINTTTPPLWSRAFILLNQTVSIPNKMYNGHLLGVLDTRDQYWGESTGMIVIFACGILVPIALTVLNMLPWPTKLLSIFNGYFVDSPVWGRHHSSPVLGLGMVPTRGQAFLILYLIAVNVWANAYSIHVRWPNLSRYHDQYYEVYRFIGNRAGALCFANIPLIILYSGRNNPLLWVTNWSYSTYLLMHRWIAIICVLQACLHSAMWLAIDMRWGGYAEDIVQPYWIWGIVGTMALCLLLSFSILHIRKHWYELFLIGHIILAIIALVGAYYHIVDLYTHSGGYDLFIIAAMGIWAGERLIRLTRVSKTGLKRAYISKIGTEYIRVDVPGAVGEGYCYAYFPTLSWRPWENHPFSPVDYNYRGTSNWPTAQLDSPAGEEIDVIPQKGGQDSSVHTAVDGSTDQSPHWRKQNGITFFIKVHKGITKLLAAKCGAENGIPILIEGSYGPEGKTMFQGSVQQKFAPNLEYSNLVCIAGGAGISAVLPVLNSSHSIYGLKGTTKVYWGLRHKALADAVETNIAGWIASRDHHRSGIELHITIGSRMNIRRILEQQLSCSVGTTVVVCGPLGMCDEVRHTVAALARHGNIIRLVQQSQVW